MRGIRQARIHDLPVAVGLIAIVVGGLALVGWLLAIDGLKSIVPGLLTMKVNTALAFVLLGGGLILRARPPGSRANRLAVVPVLAVIGLAGAVGSQYLTGASSGLDQWLVRELPGQVGTVHPNRMSPMTVICFVIVGLAVLLSNVARARSIVPALLLVAMTVASLNILDFVFGAEAPSILVGATQMALNTAVTMTVVALGAMGLLPKGGPLEVFAGPSSSARLARRLVAASVATPIVLAWLRSQGEERGLYDSRYGTSLMVLGTFLCLAVVIWQGARSARQTELDREAAFEERDRFFDVSVDLLATASANGYFVRLNPAWTATLGYEIDELCARPFVDFVHPDDRNATVIETTSVTGGGHALNFQNRYRHRDGSYRWLEWTASPSADRAWIYASARDVTDRKLEEERLRAPLMAVARRTAQAQELIRSTIETAAFGPVYQPVVDLATGSIVGFEALSRFSDGTRPDEMFAMAVDCGLGIELERATLGASVRFARGLPPRTWLSLNVSPTLLADVDTLMAALGMRVRPLVLEVTEHEAIPVYGPLRQALVDLGPDVRLAVDDAGAGIANFHHLVELRPDFVKIDASLIRGVDIDVSRQAAIAGILHFAAAADCQAIAEGIETERELAMLTQLGVRLGQGYLLGRPAPVETWLGAKRSSLGSDPVAKRHTRQSAS